MSDQFGAEGGYTPMPGEPARSPAVRGPAPAPVLNAVRLMLARAALGVVSVLVVLATKDTLRAEILKRNRTADPARLDTLVNTALVVGIVFAIIFILLYVLLALQVGKGKNWARVVTWVLAGIGVLSALASLAQAAPVASRLLSLLSGALDVAVIVFLAQRDSSRYFSAGP